MSLFGRGGVFDDIGRFAGKAARNPIVQGVVGATLSPFAAAALGAAGRGSQPGANIGDIAKAGLGGYGAGQAGNLAQGGFSKLLHAGQVPDLPVSSVADQVAPPAGFHGVGSMVPPQSGGLASRLGSIGQGAADVARGTGRFVEKNPNLSAMLLKGTADAFADDPQDDLARYELEQRKGRSHRLGQYLQNTPYFQGER